MDNDNQLPPAPVSEDQELEKVADDVAFFFEVITSSKSGLTHLVALPDEIPVADGVYQVHVHERPQPAVPDVEALADIISRMQHEFWPHPVSSKLLAEQICNWIEEQQK